MQVVNQKKKIKDKGIALCSILQNYSANMRGENSLLQKASAENIELTEELLKSCQEVMVSMDMEEFLVRFFGMWWEDAHLLAQIIDCLGEDEHPHGEHEGMDGEGGKPEGEMPEGMPEGRQPDYQKMIEDACNVKAVKKAFVQDEMTIEERFDVLAIQKAFETGVSKLGVEFSDEINSDAIIEIVKKTMKTDGGEQFGKEDYAYTPSDNVSEWKLRINDKAHVDAAVQALSPAGLMGNKVQIPEKDLPAVKAKVKAAYHKFNPQVKDTDMPDILKACGAGMKEDMAKALVFICPDCGHDFGGDKPDGDCPECGSSNAAQGMDAADVEEACAKIKKTCKVKKAAEVEVEKQEEIEKSQEALDLQKANADLLKANAEQKRQLEELQAQMADIAKAREAEAKAGVEEIVKAYGYVVEEDREALVVALNDVRKANLDSFSVIVKALEKANTVQAEYATKAEGVEVSSVEAEQADLAKSAEDQAKIVSEILKARREAKK